MAALPLAARAQQPVEQKRVGVLMGTADDIDGQERAIAAVSAAGDVPAMRR